MPEEMKWKKIGWSKNRYNGNRGVDYNIRLKGEPGVRK